MGLSAEEKKQLKLLQRKAEEPDPPPIGKNVNVAIDLGDTNQIAMAKKYGFLPGDEEEEEEETEEEEEEEETPRRRGFFKEGEK